MHLFHTSKSYVGDSTWTQSGFAWNGLVAKCLARGTRKSLKVHTGQLFPVVKNVLRLWSCKLFRSCEDRREWQPLVFVSVFREYLQLEAVSRNELGRFFSNLLSRQWLPRSGVK